MEKFSKKKIAYSLIWKFLERIGVQGVQFVLQLLLARLLGPEPYGTLGMMVIFVNLANVFTQNGFNLALVQNKDVTEEDYSSVLWVSMGIAGGIYGLLFAAAPFIGTLYRMPDFAAPFRVLCMMLFPGALNSVQVARFRRNMDFKKVFFSNMIGVLISGVIGIALALLGWGLWALVCQSLLNTVISCIVMGFTAKLRLRLACNLQRVRVLFSYGWKLLVSGLIATLYQDLRSLVIGLKYNASTLAYYNRGKQFPQFLINAVDNTVKTVMLPAMSAEQDNKERVKTLMRHSITLSAYLIFPMMAGLAAVAKPLITLLLTEEWLPAVPYLQIYCFTLAFYPVHSCNLQAINAMGRSDIHLKLEVIKKAYGLAALVIATFCFDSPLAIAATGAITALLSCFVNATPNQKLVGYTYWEQTRDVLPSMVAALVMFGCVLLVGQLRLPVLGVLVVQVLAGVVIYIALSALFGLKGFKTLWKVAKDFITDRKKK